MGFSMASGSRRHPQYEEITKKWGGMKVRKELGPRIDAWLQAFPQEHHAFLLELLKHFFYYSDERVGENVAELYNRFLNDYKGDMDDVVFSKMIKKLGVSYSDSVFLNFWLQNNTDSNMVNDALDLLNVFTSFKTIVIVDDYSGTGFTFIETINMLLQASNSLSLLEIYFLVLHITPRAIKEIKNYSKQVNLNIKVIYLDCSDETFKKGYIFEASEADRKKTQYLKLCDSQNVNEYVLGFENVSSLVAFSKNTPNNTLGLFWHDLAHNSALFPRRKKLHNKLYNLRKADAQRKNDRDIVVVYGIPDSKIKNMLIYCLGHENNFQINDFIETFGITASQAHKALQEMIDKEYLYKKDGLLKPTSKLKSRIFVSRIKKGQNRFRQIDKEEHQDFEMHEEYVPLNF